MSNGQQTKCARLAGSSAPCVPTRAVSYHQATSIPKIHNIPTRTPPPAILPTPPTYTLRSLAASATSRHMASRSHSAASPAAVRRGWSAQQAAMSPGGGEKRNGTVWPLAVSKARTTSSTECPRPVPRLTVSSPPVAGRGVQGGEVAARQVADVQVSRTPVPSGVGVVVAEHRQFRRGGQSPLG